MVNNLESPCRRLRREFLEQRFGDHPDFIRVRNSLDELDNEIAKESEVEQHVMGCYSEHLSKLNIVINRLSTDQIKERYADFKSELFSTSMMFFSSLSEQMKQYLGRVETRLRGLPTNMKRQFLNYMQDSWVEKMYPMLQRFIDMIDKVARRLGVDSYSVSLNYAFMEVGFSFKPDFSKDSS